MISRLSRTFNRMKMTCNCRSKLVIVFICLAVFLQTSSLHAWKWGNGIIYWDTISYYAYLPAIFVHKDLSLDFIREKPEEYNNRFWPQTTAEGQYVIKTTSGLAFLYFPFFISAHLLADAFGYEPDGFSEIYQAILAFSPLFYLLAGLIFLRKILLRYFSDTITSVTLLATGLATNLFYYSSVTTMSHTYSFALICAFLYTSIMWLENPDLKKSMFIGLLIGLITLIRPTNIIIILFSFLYGVFSFRDLAGRFVLFLKEPLNLLVILTMFMIIWMPQLLYWKHQTGQFFYDSYQGRESFFWTRPVILKGLFGFRKGWLIYSPVMIFALAGIIISYKNLRQWFLPLITIIPVAVYVILSWWTWWYGGGFGMRPIIDFYGLLAIPLALCLSLAGNLKPVLKYSTLMIFFFLFSLGFFHHLQAVHGAIHWDAMTWKSYRYNFGHIRMTKKAENHLENPDYEEARRGINR